MENIEEVKQQTRFQKAIAYLSITSSGMALGLFATLIIGVVISEVGKAIGYVPIDQIGIILKSLMGAGIALGIALTLKQNSLLEIVSCMVVGAIATSLTYNDTYQFTFALNSNGNPLMAYLVVIITIALTKLILIKKTPIDIILVPLLYVVIGSLITFGLIIPITIIIDGIEIFVSTATTYQPFLMGIVIAVVMGMCLTAPISSVAIAIAINLSGIGGGAAAVGCCVQMVGFATQSARENNIGKVLSVGIGTSMLQYSNIIKNPRIWLPTIITSAILGPLSTTVFMLESSSIGAGMGTCALLGPIQLIITTQKINVALAWSGTIVLCIVAPIIMVFLLDLALRKINWIKEGDLRL